MLSAGNWDYILALGQHPSKRKLRGLAFLFGGDLFHAAHQLEVLLEVLSLETRGESPVVVRRQVFESFNLTSEKAASKRTISHEPKAQLTAGGQDFLFGGASPERIFALDRSDGMNFGRAGQSFRAGFRETPMADLAFFH